jgi:hypothetical protein
MGSRGPSRIKMASGWLKTPKTSNRATPFGGCFGHFSGVLARLFFDVFLGRFFSSPGRHLGAQRLRKGAKMEPKVVEKVVQRQLVERVKSMAGTVRERHGEVPGRVQEPVFSGTRCEGFRIRSRGGLGMIFCDFRCPLGIPWGSIFREKRC